MDVRVWVISSEGLLRFILVGLKLFEIKGRLLAQYIPTKAKESSDLFLFVLWGNTVPSV